MKHFKSHNIQHGQTFIEVVLAVFMVGSVVSAILTLQNTVFTHVATSTARMRRLIVLEQFYQEQNLADRMQGKEKKTEESKNPEATIKMAEKQPTSESGLHSFKNTVVVQLEAVWNYQNTQYKESLTTLRYKKPEGKK